MSEIPASLHTHWRPGKHEKLVDHIETRHALRLACLFVGFLLLASLVEAQDHVEATTATTHAPHPRLRVEIIGDTVTVAARDVTVKALLEEMAHQGGLMLVLRDPANDLVTQEFTRLPLLKALGRIVGHRGFALDDGRGGNARDTQPRTLWVFPDTTKDHHVWPAGRADQAGSMNGDAGPRPDAGEGLSAFSAQDRTAPLSPASTHDDVDARFEAVSALAGKGGDQAAAALTAALSDRDPSVREEAVYALGMIGGQTATQSLRQALMDPQPDVRTAAIAALTDIGGEDSAQALATALRDHDASLRQDAVDALGEIGGPTAIRLLQQALRDEDAFVRETAAEYLAERLSKARVWGEGKVVDQTPW